MGSGQKAFPMLTSVIRSLAPTTLAHMLSWPFRSCSTEYYVQILTVARVFYTILESMGSICSNGSAAANGTQRDRSDGNSRRNRPVDNSTSLWQTQAPYPIWLNILLLVTDSELSFDVGICLSPTLLLLSVYPYYFI